MITGVTVHAVCRASDATIVEPSAAYMADLIIIGKATGYSAHYAYLPDYIRLTGQWQDISFTWPINPSTGLPWTEEDIIDLRIGVWLWASAWVSGESRCTQVYAVVQRDVPGSVTILRPSQDWNQYGIPTDGYLKVQESSPDGDAGYVAYTTSGGTLPDAGAKFLFWVVPRRNLTMAKQGQGTITPNTGNYEYADGDIVNISAVPQAGWRFVEWVGGVAEPLSPQTAVTMDADKNITAVFEQLPVTHELTVSIIGNGTTEPPPGTYSYNHGDQVDLSAFPGAGYHFVRWDGDVADSASPDTYTVMNSTKGVRARFVIDEEPPPPEEAGFPWWLLILAAIGVGAAAASKKKKKQGG